MSISNECFPRPILGGHGKFVFRQGWLKKGYDIIESNPKAFFEEDAYIKLGVGKNMADSIRYWCQALNILEENNNSDTREYKPTEFGKLIFGKKGSDPYLEKYGSLWLLHWQICNNQIRGRVNKIIFSKIYEIEFKKHQLVSLLGKELPRYDVKTTDKMIEREVDIFLRTYVPARTKKVKSIEDSLDCPLADLNLITHFQADDIYRFRIGPKKTLPLSVFNYSFISFIKQIAGHRRTVGIDEIIYSQGSPGQIFKLDENSVMQYLEKVEENTNKAVQLQETAGLRQIYLHKFDTLNEFQIFAE